MDPHQLYTESSDYQLSVKALIKRFQVHDHYQQLYLNLGCGNSAREMDRYSYLSQPFLTHLQRQIGLAVEPSAEFLLFEKAIRNLLRVRQRYVIARNIWNREDFQILVKQFQQLTESLASDDRVKKSMQGQMTHTHAHTHAEIDVGFEEELIQELKSAEAICVFHLLKIKKYMPEWLEEVKEENLPSPVEKVLRRIVSLWCQKAPNTDLINLLEIEQQKALNRFKKTALTLVKKIPKPTEQVANAEKLALVLIEPRLFPNRPIDFSVPDSYLRGNLEALIPMYYLLELKERFPEKFDFFLLPYLPEGITKNLPGYQEVIPRGFENQFILIPSFRDLFDLWMFRFPRMIFLNQMIFYSNPDELTLIPRWLLKRLIRNPHLRMIIPLDWEEEKKEETKTGTAMKTFTATTTSTTTDWWIIDDFTRIDYKKLYQAIMLSGTRLEPSALEHLMKLYPGFKIVPDNALLETLFD